VVGGVVPEEIEVSVLPGRKYGIEDFLRIAWRRKWLIVIPFVVVSFATVAVVRRLPDEYKSETTILVVPQRVPESYVRSTVTDRIGERLQSLEQQILSRSRLEKIIVDLNLYQELRATSSMESLVNRLRAAVAVDPVVRGDAFTISHTSRDPKTAQIVTERLATDFIRLNVADRGTLAQTTSVFLKERLVEQEKRLIEQEKKLEDYRVAHAGELPSQAGSNLQGMQSSRAQLQTVVDSINHERERLGTKERELADLLAPDPVSQAVAAAAVTTPPSSGVPAAPALSPADELIQARAQLEVMEGRLTDVHPDVRRMRRRVGQLETQVRLQAQAEKAQAGSPASVAAPPVVRTVASVQKENRIRDARADLAAINRRIGALQKEQGRLQQEINLYQARLEMVPIRESEQVELTRDYETTNELYRDLLSKHEEAKIAEAMEKGRVGEQFRVLDPAVVPDRPFRPDRLKLNAVGIALGLFLGLGIVAALEFTDSTLKSEEDIRTVLALPVIATIPIFVPKVGGAMRQRLRGLLSGSGAGVVALAVTIVGSVRS
jgi:polysaccharide chain length determinant protein (PEP-CTERM system associated)